MGWLGGVRSFVSGGTHQRDEIQRAAAGWEERPGGAVGKASFGCCDGCLGTAESGLTEVVGN